jgi:hypothetical protein
MRDDPWWQRVPIWRAACAEEKQQAAQPSPLFGRWRDALEHIYCGKELLKPEK